MENINADQHPGQHRYSLELAKYPELTEAQYNSVLSDLKQPEGSVLYQNARETLICSRLAMILSMAKNTCHKYYGLSMEDYVGLGNMVKMDRSYLARTLQLANFAPDIVKLIWENRQAETLTLEKLRKGIPESWEEQRKLFLA